MHKTAQLIEEQKAADLSVRPETKKKGKRGGWRGNPKSLENLKPFQPGESGNPGGLPGTDLAALYARRLFEQHPEGIDKPLASKLKGFNAYAYSVLADRGYGKVKETQTHEFTGNVEVTVKLVKPSDSTQD